MNGLVCAVIWNSRESSAGVLPDRGDVFWACGLLKIKILNVHEKESTQF